APGGRQCSRQTTRGVHWTSAGYDEGGTGARTSLAEARTHRVGNRPSPRCAGTHCVLLPGPVRTKLLSATMSLYRLRKQQVQTPVSSGVPSPKDGCHNSCDKSSVGTLILTGLVAQHVPPCTHAGKRYPALSHYRGLWHLVKGTSVVCRV